MSHEKTDDLPLPNSDRKEVIRDMAVFQVKLFTDGFKDLVLSPLSLFAGIIGVLLGGKNPGALFYRLLRFGQRVENWIGLFSAAFPKPVVLHKQAPTSPGNPQEPGTVESEYVAGDFDTLVDRLQTSLLDPETRSRLSDQSRKQLEAIAKRLHRDRR